MCLESLPYIPEYYGSHCCYNRTARLILMIIAHVYNAVRQNTHSADFIHHFAHLIMRLMVLESRETGETWTGELGVHHFPSKYTM